MNLCKDDFKKPRFKVGNYSLKIHKSAYNLFSLFISKGGFSSLQTRKSLGEILSGDHCFLLKAWHKTCDAIQLVIILMITDTPPL